MTATLRPKPAGQQPSHAPVRIPRHPAPDPWDMAVLNAMAEHYAATYGDTGIVTAARQTDLLADLDQWQADRGVSHRPYSRLNRSTP